MHKWAVYAGFEWIADVNADTQEEARAKVQAIFCGALVDWAEKIEDPDQLGLSA